MGVAGWVVTALVSTLALGISGASGCGDTIDSKGQPETAGQRGESLGQAQQAAALTPTVCGVLRRGPRDQQVFDTQIGSEKPNTNFGTSSFIIVSGGTTTAPATPTQGLIKFDLSFLPAGATIVSAGLTVPQTNTGAANINLHLVNTLWDEATVTWNSIGGAYGPTFKSFTNATANVSVDIKNQAQAWANDSSTNNGILLEQAGSTKTTFYSSEYGVTAQKPYLSYCYKVVSPPASPTATTTPPMAARPTSTPAQLRRLRQRLPRAGQRRAAPARRASAGSAPATRLRQLRRQRRQRLRDQPHHQRRTAAPAAWPAPANAASSCASGTCKVVSCNPGSFDCNGNNTDGCEATPCGDGSHCEAN